MQLHWPSSKCEQSEKNSVQTKLPIIFHPAGTWLTVLIALLISSNNCLAQIQGGTVVAWGDNSYGQTNVPPGLTNVAVITGGQNYGIVLTTAGNVVAWGTNANLPLGMSNVVGLASGPMHTLALKNDGTVVAWGYNFYGETNVPAGLTNVVAVSAGLFHSLALKNDGSVVAWGDPYSNQTAIPSDATNVVEIAAGYHNSMALRSDGTVVEWGGGVTSVTGLEVPTGLSGVKAIAAGWQFCVALKNDGTLVAWGDNSSGQTNIPAGLSNVVAIAASGMHCLTILGDGSLAVWGDITNIPSGLQNVTAIACGDANDLALLSSAPPFFIQQPQNITVCPNTFTPFFAMPVGAIPMYYQWRFNGTNIPGATNSFFALNKVQLSDEGIYTLVTSNSFGLAASSNAFLNVLDLSEALNDTNVVWSTMGDAPWFSEGAQTHDAQAAAQSGIITNGQQSGLETTVNGPGALTFWWNVDSEANYDYLVFSVNGVEVARISGSTGWQGKTVYVGSGPVQLQWDYVKTDDVITGQDAGWVDQVSFISGGTPPFVTLNPSNQVVLLGSNVTLVANALGTPTLNYQWQLNATDLDGATSASLTLTNAQFSNEGNYSLVISNEFGITNTPAIFVNVVDFTEALNATNLTWITGGNIPWFPETSITHDGVAALQSGAIAGNQQSTLQTTVNGPGALSFWWKVSSETNNDFVNFTLDGMEQSRISGTVSWQLQTFYLTSGAHILAWTYSKNATVNGGSDAAWLDQVSYTNGTTPAFVSANPTNLMLKSYSTATYTVRAQGTPPLFYQWQFNGVNISNATNVTLTISPATWTNEGFYSVIVSNSYGFMVSSNATLSLIRSMVVGWGNNSYGQTNVPITLTNAIGIAAGYENSLAVKTDGTVVGWGYNGWQETTPPTGLSNVLAVGTSGSGTAPFSLALKSDGSVVGWGNNGAKQTNAPAGLSNVLAIAAGQGHGMALRNDGRVFVWGNNSYGQTNVPSALTNAIAIAAGLNSCLALRSNGTLLPWGDNTYGQTNIPPGLTNVTAIASSVYHCLALKNDGTITAWGYNNYQQTNVPAGLSNIVAIAAGQYHSLAVKNDGTIVAWGQNSYKQTNVPAGLNHVAFVAGGADHSLALIEDGPPVIFTQPASQTNYAGFTALLTANSSGLQPLYFQWTFNGTNISDATYATLTLTNLQPNLAGAYSFICSNALGSASSSNAVIGVVTNAPFLTLQPTNQTIIAGSNITFSVAVGAGPIPNIYQWQFNGTNILGATNLSITLTNVQVANQGNFLVVINNGYGTVTSSNAYLFVLDMATALNTPSWTWTNSGSAAWFAQTNTTHDGYEAAQSGLVNNGQSSTLQTTVTGPGTLTFWWMFSPLTSPYANTLSCSSSLGNASTSVNSTTGWQQKTIYLGAGQQSVSWNYSRYNFVSAQSTGWVDQVSFTPGGTPPTITFMSPDTYVRANAIVGLSVSAYGTPPLAYQWQLNSTNLPNKTASSLVFFGAQPTNSGIYTVVITNSYGSISTNVNLWVGQFGLNTSPTNLFMSTNGFQLQLDGILTTNPVVIFGSTDLVNWVPLMTNSATTGTVQFLDVVATNTPNRFYRARE